jgi:small subunit ribosomal protein S6
MRTYEIVFVLKTLDEKKREELVKSVKSLFSGATFTREDAWGSKSLKYKIKRETQGYYFDFEFQIETLPQGVDKQLINMEGVLRHLVIRLK